MRFHRIRFPIVLALLVLLLTVAEGSAEVSWQGLTPDDTADELHESTGTGGTSGLEQRVAALEARLAEVVEKLQDLEPPPVSLNRLKEAAKMEAFAAFRAALQGFRYQRRRFHAVVPGLPLATPSGYTVPVQVHMSWEQQPARSSQEPFYQEERVFTVRVGASKAEGDAILAGR